MSQSMLRLLMLLIALDCSAAVAAPPATLAYQGRLASASGTPISATLGITFRLYDVPAGGAALWSEHQPGVEVDGGNLAVELGRVAPLPAQVWGRQLYLGVQIAGDSELAPRPALTASPYALRAGGIMKRSVVISAEGSPAENGAALLAAVAAITDASATSPVVVELDAGTFDLGTAQLHMPAHTELAGRSQSATVLTSAFTAVGAGAAVLLSANTAARDLTARNTAAAVNAEDSVVGIAAHDPLVFQNPVVQVRLERVTGESIAAAGSNGQRAGIALCVSNSHISEITARADGGLFAMGLRSDCPTSQDVIIDGAMVFARGATQGLRGTYLAGGGLWKDIRVHIETNPAPFNIFGVRVFAAGAGVDARLLDPVISISAMTTGGPTATFFIEAIRIEHRARVHIEGAAASMENLRARDIRGLTLVGNDSDPRQLRVVDADIRITALQDALLGPGSVVGVAALGAAPDLRTVRVQVDCVAGGTHACIGVRADPPPAAPGGIAQAGPMLLEDSRIEVAHADPLDATAQSQAFQSVISARIVGSQLRVVRSADAEPATVLGVADASAVLEVLHSSLVMEDAASPDAGCLLFGPTGATVAWYGNHLQGQRCDGAQVNLTCAGNTRRGSGFLPGTCP